MPRTVKEILEQAEELATHFEQHEPDLSDPAAAEALAALHRATLDRAEAEAALAKAVQQARNTGQSWDAIGRRIGTTGEAARQRYRQSA